MPRLYSPWRPASWTVVDRPPWRTSTDIELIQQLIDEPGGVLEEPARLDVVLADRVAEGSGLDLCAQRVVLVPVDRAMLEDVPGTSEKRGHLQASPDRPERVRRG